MPSGSHSGGGRGSSSGSRMGGSFSRSSSRSSSFGGGSRSFGGGYSHHHHRPIRIRFGRRYYVYTGGGSGAIGVLIFLFFFLLFGTVITSANKNAAKSEIVNLEEEHLYYLNMIDYAKQNPEYQKQATIDGKYFDDEMDKWYLTYSIELDNGFGDLPGYTFAQYDSADIYRFIVGEEMTVAVDNKRVNSQTDSINMDYDNVELEDVGEYILAKKSAKTSTIVWVVFCIIDILTVVGIVLYFVKKMKREEEKEEKKEEPKVDTNIVCCKYCGTVSDKATKKCPGCGAGLRR